MSDLGTRIEEQRQKYGDDLLILGHHYQRSSVIRHADARGDSLELARKAAASKAKRIVFCGVHFMAESADILTADTQSVYLPDCHAGCPMADMADAEQTRDAWQQRQKIMYDEDELIDLAESWRAQTVVPYACGGAPWRPCR